MEFAQDLVEAAVRLRDDGPGRAPGRIVRDLFGRVPAEDLAPYPAEALADLAAASFDRLGASHVEDGGAVSLTDVTVERGGPRRELTILEAVNENRPFLLDSTLAVLVERGLEPLLVAHPILGVERDGGGRLLRVVGETTASVEVGLRRESLIHIHLNRIEDASIRTELIEELGRAYADVALATRDWSAMRAAVTGLISSYRGSPPPLPPEEISEAVAFLEWITSDRFVFLGLGPYDLDEAELPVPSAGLGILADPSVKVLRTGRDETTPEIRAFRARPKALVIAKASAKSRVHRRAYLDYVGVKLFSPGGRLAGEVRIVGLFTSEAYTSRTEEVPYLRRKVAGVIARAGLDPQSHAGRSLRHVLEDYPRDELFQIDDEVLAGFASAIMALSERPRIRALARPDEFDRFVSVLVFIPKDRYDTDVRRRVGDFLANVYGGHLSAAYPAYPEGALARTHYIIGRPGGAIPAVEPAMLESGIAAIVRTWGDALRSALVEQIGGARARELGQRYADAFSGAYREAFDPGDALADITTLEALSEERPRAVELYRRERDGLARVNLKLFAFGAALPLSERVPLLENLGFRVVHERTYRILPSDAGEDRRAWLHDMALERASGAPIDLPRIREPVEAALLALFRGATESDGFNRLVLEGALDWRRVSIVRALARYLRQIRVPYGQGYLATTLARHAGVTGRILALFEARFDPAAEAGRAEAERRIAAQIEGDLSGVASLDDDLILRRFANLVQAVVRTNAYQTGSDGEPRPTLAMKFDCRRIEVMPRPRPLYEIFVYSPRVEGLHLRFGKVARGGIRWSERPHDFRTEVLGLAKAQQVKNAVIVPVGAKGGFVPKRLPAASDRGAWLAEGTEAYRLFVGTLLDLTDTIEGDRIVGPPATVRHDGDDPYLVVAADKGTAGFSDVANALSEERRFWLGDAFASGGSHGYDHKHMGITARGAWEAVERHFREMGVDVEREPVTVAGVGDMSGDVFGNGMLLSRAIKLVAAFDHRHIFLDPDPDPERSWTERRRLFALPRSSWADYDQDLISPGGGVFSRAAKAIPFSPEIQALLALEATEATPAEVMRAILRAPVGLLWFGGIGTYIRASTETDETVGDRSNDPIRITGAEVRAKVIGEGANLASTQRGRIEAARRGVRLNTDAIDNSAGVNTSDVEVNIKIALAGPEQAGRITRAARNDLLAGVTDEVARLVLRNNYLQTLAISLAERRGASGLAFAGRLMQRLEREGRLDRTLEFLPSDAELGERATRGEALTRPELAILLAYAKLSLHDELLDSPVPDDPYLATELERYFPLPMRERFPEAVAGHRLRRDIIATQLANAIVNRGGPTIVVRLVDETGTDAPTIAAAYAVTRDAFGLIGLNAAIDALDGTMPGERQLGLYAEVQDLLMGRLAWFIRNADLAPGSLDRVVGRYRAGLAEIEAALPAVLPPAAMDAWRARTEELVRQGAPETLGRRIAALQDLVAAPDIVLVAERTGRPAVEVAAVHFPLDEMFRIGVLAAAARGVPVTDAFDRLALDRALDALADAHRRLTAEVIRQADGSGPEAVASWRCAAGAAADRIGGAVETIAASGLTLAKVTVAASLLGDLTRG